MFSRAGFWSLSTIVSDSSFLEARKIPIRDCKIVDWIGLDGTHTSVFSHNIVFMFRMYVYSKMIN